MRSQKIRDKRNNSSLVISLIVSFCDFKGNGIVQLSSARSFSETLERLRTIVQSKGLTIFATINFSDDAATAGLKMNLTKLLIFGNPKAGTPLMVAASSVAIDFPLKILVSEDKTGKTWISYNSLEYLKERHQIPDELIKNISGIVAIAESAAK